jgi:hypothetical protein
MSVFPLKRVPPEAVAEAREVEENLPVEALCPWAPEHRLTIRPRMRRKHWSQRRKA